MPRTPFHSVSSNCTMQSACWLGYMLLCIRFPQCGADLPSHLRSGQKKSIQSKVFRSVIASLSAHRSVQENSKNKSGDTFIHFGGDRGSSAGSSLCSYFPNQQPGPETKRTFQVAEESDMKVRGRRGFREENKAAFIPGTVRGVESRAAASELCWSQSGLCPRAEKRQARKSARREVRERFCKGPHLETEPR